MLAMRRIRILWCGAAVPVAVVCLLMCSGCLSLRENGREGAELVPQGRKPRRVATRDELLTILAQDMSRLESLQARATVTIIDQNVVAPVWQDRNKYERGEPYRKRFRTSEVTARLYMYRPYTPDSPEKPIRRVRFTGEIIGVNRSFLLLGKDDDFLIVMPNLGVSKGDPDAPRGFVYVGKAEREARRPKDFISMRPQDLSDLLLVDEVFPALRGEYVCFMETWEDFYILNFLRQEWRPEPLYSRVWIERERLMVAIHQLFDGSGELIAEARFGSYKTKSAEGIKVEAQIPTEVIFLWPRDKLVIRAKLSDLAVNGPIDEKYWKRPHTPDYEVRDLERLKKLRRQGPEG